MSDTPETDGEWNRIACYEHPQFEQGIADLARKLERERNELRAGLLTMISTANAVVERWETPNWKEAMPTATFIHALRDAVDKMKGLMP